MGEVCPEVSSQVLEHSKRDAAGRVMSRPRVARAERRPGLSLVGEEPSSRRPSGSLILWENSKPT